MPNLTGKNTENPLPESENMEKLSNEFADYFLEKIQMIRIELDHNPKYQLDWCDMQNWLNFILWVTNKS